MQDRGGGLKEAAIQEKQTNCSAPEWIEIRRRTEKEEREKSKRVWPNGGPMDLDNKDVEYLI